MTLNSWSPCLPPQRWDYRCAPTTPGFCSAGDGTRSQHSRWSLPTTSAAQVLVFNTRQKYFSSPVSHRSSRIAKARELLTVNILGIFTYFIWIFRLWIYPLSLSLYYHLSITIYLSSPSLFIYIFYLCLFSLFLSVAPFTFSPLGWKQGFTHTRQLFQH